MTYPQPNGADAARIADEVLATLPETIVQVDPEERVVHVNREDSPVFRRKVRVDDRLADVLVPEAAEALTGIFDNVGFTGGAIAEFRTDYDLFRVTARPLSSAPYTLLVFRNITGIRTAGQTIVDLVRDRSNFIAAVSHELRTPLTAVVGYANLLADSASTLDDGTRTALVRDMADQAWDLAGIIEDLLTVASAELGELHMAKVGVDLAANTAQVIESMGLRAEEITVEASQPVIGIGDPARFRQVVRNLLSNAVGHGETPVEVTITRTGDTAAIVVSDRGPGVPDGVAALLGDDGAGGRSSTPADLGLGLWICQELTRLMGGSLAYRREAGTTSFEASIPSM